VIADLIRLLGLTNVSGLDSPSPADRGDRELRNAKSNGRYSDFRTDVPGMCQRDSIIPTDTVLECQNEAFLNAALYPYLQPIFLENNSFLVNSEKIRWLPARPGTTDTKFDKMPDFFGCPPWLYERKSSYNVKSNDLKGMWRANGVNFGSIPWVVRDGLDVTCETKLNFGTDGLGELLDYLARIGTGPCQPEELRGLYLRKSGFMMVVVINGVVAEITECLWKTSGSRELLSKFLGRKKCIWRMGLEKLCTAIGVRLFPSEAFLGKGGRGHVFKVSFQGEVCALKMVVADFSECTRMEVEVIAGHCLLPGAQDHIVSLRSETVYSVDNILDVTSAAEPVPVIGYLMNSVGSAAPNKTAWDRYKIFMSLACLHRLGIVHGDARLANIMLVNGDSLRWIDFMNSHITSSRTEFKNDAVTLVKSMYNMISLSVVVMDMLNDYADNVKVCPSFEQFQAALELK